LDVLLNQAREYQVASCTYHVGIPEYSLYHDHVCSRNQFPFITSHILEGHTDEVWQVQWSHSGRRLASASKDHTVIIWRMVSLSLDKTPIWSANVNIKAQNAGELDFGSERVLDDHEFSVTAIAWSPDDKLLLSSAHSEVKLWDVEVGVALWIVEHRN
jgi:WD40 repeat protein